MAASRSFAITLRNVTQNNLHKMNQNLEYGEWSGNENDVPPENIPPFTRAWCSSESDGFATGTEGTVTYDTGVGHIFIHWNNPFVGGNGLGISGSSFRDGGHLPEAPGGTKPILCQETLMSW